VNVCVEREAIPVISNAGGRHLGRRQLLRGSLVVATFGMLPGCEMPGRRAPNVPRIGFLAVGSREGRAFLIDGFLKGLREHGYVEGQNIRIEYRFSEGRNEKLPELAAELVASRVTLIVASGTPASFAAGQATSTIPIVMGSLAANPVETGLIASLARPGGNITGMTEMASQLSGKRLELLKACVPGLSRVAVFWNPPNAAYGPVLQALEAAAPTLGVKIQRVEVRVPEDFEGALEAATRQRAGALFVPGDPLVTNRPRVVAELALKYRLPTITDFRELPQAGGLLSFGPDLVDSYRRAAAHVDKILKGANPADLPMEQPTKFDLVVNLTTARAFGLTIPHSVLHQATQVIQ
jgi:putative tryptophan/tyrosine transport system substrate-binding protein